MSPDVHCVVERRRGDRVLGVWGNRPFPQGRRFRFNRPL